MTLRESEWLGLLPGSFVPGEETQPLDRRLGPNIRLDVVDKGEILLSWEWNPVFLMIHPVV
jgi:hypothetical protein